jgi:uncharacterized protein (DUF1697 family)
MRYVALLRGINVGGKNKVPMAELKTCLESLGFTNVSTYIASGNVIFESNESVDNIKAKIEKALPEYFALHSELIKVLLLSHSQLQSVINNKPPGFGDQSDKYHSDVVFLMDLAVGDAMQVFDPKEGIDRVWPGKGVIYSQRLSALRTKSRLSKIIGTPAYRSMTIRTWNTVTILLELLKTD